MATRELYEPKARIRHAHLSVESGILIRGGRTLDLDSSAEDARIHLADRIELFDPFLEVWRQLNTTGTPHSGLYGTGCASVAEQVYMYGGICGKRYEGDLSNLNLKTLTWSQLCPEAISAGGPMRKRGCGILIPPDGNKVVVIGGYGYLTGPLQPESTFISDTKVKDGRGYTNEIHFFDINQGRWSSPLVKGTRPPPCTTFTLTSIDKHRGILFGGHQPKRGRVSDLFIFDFDAMEITCTKVERGEGEPWPVGRSFHAATCLGHAGDHVHLLVTGGVGRDGGVLKDMWLFNVSLKKWKEVTLPDDGTLRLGRWGHSVTAVSLCQGIVDVNVFGGSPDEYEAKRPAKDIRRISETTIVSFEQHGSEWMMVDVVDNRQRGSNERVREKMVKVSAALIGERQCMKKALATSQANEKRLEERVRDLEERQRAQQAEEKSHNMEAKLREQKEECERRIREAEKQVVALEQKSHDLQQQNIVLTKCLQEMKLRDRESEGEPIIIHLKDSSSLLIMSDSDILSSKDFVRIQNSTWDARSQWYNIGLNLAISVDTLDAVKRSNNGNCECCYNEVLAVWLRSNPRPTWSALADALKAPSVKMNHIAKELPLKN